MKISIVGATGGLGSGTAYTIAVMGLADEIVLLGRRHNFLQHHAGDIGTAALSKDVLIRAGEDADMKGSDIVIITAGAPEGSHFSSRRELLGDNFIIVKEVAGKIRQFCRDALIITATAPVEAMNYTVYSLLGAERHRVMGYTLNDSLRFRSAIAATLKVKPSSIGGMVIGEHGESQVLLFSSISVDGKKYKPDSETIKAIETKVLGYLPWHISLKTGLTSGWTCAAGIASMVRAIRDDSGEVIPCSVSLDSEYGCHKMSMTVPASLGRGGVRTIQELQLSEEENLKLKKSIETIMPYTQYIEDNIRAA